jgi:membrane dipeptidase
VKPATLDDVLKHLFHAIEIAGVEHVGIGADMDGGGGVAGLEDVGTYPKITLALLKHGLSEADVEKIWGGNTLRLLRAAEDFAKSQKKT